jgi:hypothetical protein
MTTSLIGKLWNGLRHPPLSYLGDDFQYRAADGSNNVHTPLSNSVTVEHHVSAYWKSRNPLCKKRGTTYPQTCRSAGSWDYI